MVELKNDKIVIELIDHREERREAQQPDTRQTQEAGKVMSQLTSGASLTKGLPYVGEYVSKADSLVSKATNVATTLMSGNPLAVGALAIAALGTAHTVAKDYVMSKRQSAEMQRRAGYVRRGE